MIRQVESFLAIVEDGSIAAASRRLQLTPGAVAQRLKALEQDLGVRLVSRSGRFVRPTDAGNVLISRARDVLQSVQSLRQCLLEGRPRYSFRIGATTSATIRLIPSLLAALSKDHPNVDFTIVCQSSVKLRQAILTHEIDAAITTGHSNRLPKSCSWVPLQKQHLVMLVSSMTSERCPAEFLSSRSFIKFRCDDCATLVDLYLCKTGSWPRTLAELESYEAVEQLVADDIGFSLVPAWIAPPSRGVAHLPLLHFEQYDDLGLLWRRGPVQALVVQTIISRLTRILNDLDRLRVQAPETANERGRAGYAAQQHSRPDLPRAAGRGSVRQLSG